LPYVFISYVRSNKSIVDHLKNDLTIRHGVKVWLDRDDIGAGVDWRQAIRKAIQDGAFFIACFSEEYNERDRTYMDEELTLAIDELRRRPTDKAWFIPVKLNECEIPDCDIGGRETLDALQYVELYKDWDDGIQRILNVILASLIMDALSSDHVPFRITAIEDLGRIGYKAAIPVLTEILLNHESCTCKAAVDALVEIGIPAIPALITTLRIEALSDRYVYAAVALEKIGTPAIPALTEALKDENYGVRKYAASTLGEIGDPTVVPDLIEVREDHEFYRGEYTPWHPATSALRQIGKLAVPALTEALKDQDDSVREYVASVLGKIRDPTAIPALLEVLTDENDQVREAAVSALGDIGDPTAIPVLTKALRDESHKARESAVFALREIVRRTGKPAVPALIEALIEALRDENDSVREIVVSALGEIGGPTAIPALIEALRDDNVRKRATSALAGARISTPAIPALIGALRDEDVREHAASVLGKIGGTAAISALIEALRDDDYIFCKYVVSALRKIGTAHI